MRTPAGDAHLTYCMNVHPAASLADVLDNLRRCTAVVRRQVCPDQPFAVGLWLPASALAGLRTDAAALGRVLADEGLYLATINGFPYGPFHGGPVKTRVYHPDWGTVARLDYTCALFDILAQLLPEGVHGSVSTVPVTYGKTLPDTALDNLAAAAAHIRALSRTTGRQLSLALEPEPDCYLENTAETVAFFDAMRRVRPDITNEVGVCFDTCHIALQREDLTESWTRLAAAGIAVPKVQVSAALTCDNADGCRARRVLQPFAEPVYLHQTRISSPVGQHQFTDLPAALAANLPGQWLVHYHLPLHFPGNTDIGTTAAALTPPFLRLIAATCPVLEVETYTFDVLPPPKPDIVTSIADEMHWLIRQLAATEV